ncbi:metallopeptidase family protein [Nakamurella sp.]|uniref:metallopeptidase family protein n=1 Tax=Nakamurella sp. TaxID=1869182 RepID=UPI003B3B63C2
MPADLPASRTRAERFDQAVLEAVADLEVRWPGRMETLEFAVDEVPAVPAQGQETASNEVVLDGGVPLARFLPPGMDNRGRPTKARIVVYRRPLEVRSGDAGELGDLVTEVLAELLADVLGDPDDEDGPVS